MNQTVTESTKGIDRLRTGSLRRYLSSKRPVGPGSFQRLIGFRTEACVGYNLAVEDGAPDDVIAALRFEYEWAVAELRRSPAGADVLEQLDAGADRAARARWGLRYQPGDQLPLALGAAHLPIGTQIELAEA